MIWFQAMIDDTYPWYFITVDIVIHWWIQGGNTFTFADIRRLRRCDTFLSYNIVMITSINTSIQWCIYIHSVIPAPPPIGVYFSYHTTSADAICRFSAPAHAGTDNNAVENGIISGMIASLPIRLFGRPCKHNDMRWLITEIITDLIHTPLMKGISGKLLHLLQLLQWMQQQWNSSRLVSHYILILISYEMLPLWK